MGGFNGAWLDRHGIRPSYLGLGGPLLLGLGVRPPRSVSHLFPLVTLMLRVLRCRVESLALTHTRTDIFGAVAIWDQRRTMLSIFVVPPTARLHQGCWLCFIRELPGLVAAPPGVRAGSSPLVRSRLRALFTTGLFVANACLSCLVLGRSLQLRLWACCQMPPIVLHPITSMASWLYPKPCPSFGSMPKPCSCYLSNHLGFGPCCFSGILFDPCILSACSFCAQVTLVSRPVCFRGHQRCLVLGTSWR